MWSRGAASRPRNISSSHTFYAFDWEWPMINIEEIELNFSYVFTEYSGDYWTPSDDVVENFEIEIKHVKVTAGTNENDAYKEAQTWLDKNLKELTEYYFQFLADDEDW